MKIEDQKPTKVSDMLRYTAGNNSQLLMQIADHIDKLESHIAALEANITSLQKEVFKLGGHDDYK